VPVTADGQLPTGAIEPLFMVIILAPSNSQTYNRQVFLFTSLSIVAGAARRPLRRGCPTSIAIESVPPGVSLCPLGTARTPRTERSCKEFASNSRQASSD
jgi:hypothetical protein